MAEKLHKTILYDKINTEPAMTDRLPAKEVKDPMQRSTRLTGQKRAARMRLKQAKRTYDVTYRQCRRIIKLFIKGMSIATVARLTGISQRKIVEVLVVARELMRRDAPRHGESVLSSY